jgi:major capsid protein
MSEFTDSVSRPGRALNEGTDDRALFLTEFGGRVLLAYEEALDYQGLRYVRNITQGKADTFPIIGRKRDAVDHTPGELILGGTIEHNEVTITLDQMLVDAAFIAEVDELMNHYDLMAPYTTQLGQSLGVTTAKRIAIMHILASRDTGSGLPEGLPAPSYYFDADVATDGAKLEEAAFEGARFLRENDISGSMPTYMLPHQQHLLLARYSGIEGGPVSTGSGNRSTGTVGMIAGLSVKGTNHIPSTNITTGLSKYQGDFTTTIGHISSMMAVGTLERRGLRIVMKQQDERLGTIMIASMFNGHGKLRPECSFEVADTTR